jgi:uncharacterized NAD(P)/FAD-binding protein YdhS
VSFSDKNLPAGRPRVVIVGGGVSSIIMCVQLIRYTTRPVDVTIVEPRECVGPGLAYSATDPDHRLNAPLDIHWLDPRRPEELRAWCESRNIFDRDPGCLTENGQVFLRRSDLGDYLSHQFQRHRDDPRLGSTVAHLRDSSVAVTCTAGIHQVRTASGQVLEADMLVIATGNPMPALRPPFRAQHAHIPRIIGNPLAPHCLDAVAQDGRVLVVGSGLTALDVVSTLVRKGHRSQILVVSRRGLRPRPQSPETLRLPPAKMELTTSLPDFLLRQPLTVRAWTRAIRGEIRKLEAEGKNWYAAFDPVRNVVSQLWPRLPNSEKQRFLRRLRVFYDVHRFRSPPMNDAMVTAAEQRGVVRFTASRLLAVHADPTVPRVAVDLIDSGSSAPRTEEFDFVINCTGLDVGEASKSNPFLRDLLDQGKLRLHATGLGFDVTEECAALDAQGRPQPMLRVVGPPTMGAFGDPVAIPFIANQVHRILPDLIGALETVRPCSGQRALPSVASPQ